MRSWRAPLTPTEHGAAVQSYLDGAPSAEIAEAYGVHKTTIIRWVRAAGFTRRPGGPPPHDDALRAEALDAFRKGNSAECIANELGVNKQSVRNWAYAAGMPSRPSGKPCAACNHPDRQLIDKLLLSGEPSTAIARRVGIPDPNLRHHARTHLGFAPETYMNPVARRCAICQLPLELLREIEAALRPHSAPVTAIAERYGIGLGTVRTHRRRHLDNAEYLRRVGLEARRRYEALRIG